jgi:hypothetical protein
MTMLAPFLYGQMDLVVNRKARTARRVTGVTVAISGVLVQPFRLFWYGENDVLVQRRPEVIST